MKRFNQLTQKVLALVLTIAAVAAGHVTATAQVGTFTVTNTSGSTFTITRTSNTTATEKVMYRTVSLSAIAGTHFTATSGTLTFAANETSKTVTVTELSGASDAYKYQTASNRSYRFEVTDLGGAYLAHCNRNVSSGLTQFSGAKVSNSVTNLVTMTSGGSFSSGMASGKYLDVSYTPPTSEVQGSGKTLEGYVLIDDSYDYAQKPATVSTSTLISSTGAPASYLSTLGYKIYATVCFTEKEKDDGYQYLQIVAGNSSASYDTGADKEGQVYDPVNSLYKVCFEFADGSNAEGKAYFPHRGTTTSEFSNSAGVLHQQKYKSDTEGSGTGCIILEPTVSNITTRFDAGGNNDDTWGYKDFFVRMALCDATAPAKSGDPIVAPGPYGAGTTVYISVPFSEIVTVSGTPSLHTDWGDYNYFSGSGSNVLTFSGTIPSTFGAQLITRTLSGTITDLAGNALASTDCYKQFSSITVSLPWGGSGTQADPYVISRADQLDYMATRVNAGYGNDSFSGKYFVLTDDITYSHSIDWNTYSGASSSIENNFTPIGCYGRPFQGHFNGQGHTISGIRVWTEYTLTDNTNESLGLFGFVSGGSVSNVVLRDANIRGLKNLGGIVGYLGSGSVTGCTLYQVLVGSHAKANMATGMGIVAGYVGGTVTDCYYRDCVKGLTYQDGSNDITIMPHPERWDNVYTITTATGVGATYDSGTTITIDDATYYAEGCTFNLAYSGTIETAKVQDGYTNTYTITEGRNTLTHHDHIDATLTLPASDCTVSVRFASAWAGSGTSEAPYVITTPAQLDLLAKMVGGKGGYGYSDFEGTYFQLGNDIEYTATSDWDDATSTENNYTAIGGWRSGTTYNQFKGSFDGDGHTISGIRLYKGDSGTANGYQGLFGYVGTGGSIHDVNLADARITGQISVGGIVGLSYGTVQNCTVADNVLVASNHTGSHYHGGIVGKNYGSVSGCTSSVTLTAAYTGTDEYSAVVGWNDNGGTVENCLALGATIPAMDDYYGVIVGYNISGTLTANYYRGCTVGTTANAVGVGAGKSGGAPNDVDGARSVHTLTLPSGVTATGESITIGTDTYYAAATDVTLANSGSAPAGYVEPCYYSLDGTNIVGSTIQMPASDATVALLWTTDYETGHAGTQADPYIISDYPQLELLANRVNNGNKYSSGKFFKLGADIACFDGENNHTPIGVHGTNKHFMGTFDGDGHTVSGIRISSSTGYQGLFGYLSGATVKNVTLANSTIIGRDEVGGIVGYSFVGTFENCRVLSDVTIKANASSADYHGGIVGYIFGRGIVNGCYSAATVTRDGNSSRHQRRRHPHPQLLLRLRRLQLRQQRRHRQRRRHRRRRRRPHRRHPPARHLQKRLRPPPLRRRPGPRLHPRRPHPLQGRRLEHPLPPVRRDARWFGHRGS